MIFRTRNAIKSNTRINFMSNTQPMQNTTVFASRIQDPTRAQVWSTKDNTVDTQFFNRI